MTFLHLADRWESRGFPWSAPPHRAAADVFHSLLTTLFDEAHVRLLRLKDVPVGYEGPRYRQGVLGGLISLVLFGTILCGSAAWLSHKGAWFFAGVNTLLAVIIVPMLIGDVLVRFRALNWVLWIRADGLWINFCSYTEWDPPDLPCVIHVDYQDIDRVGEYVETFTTTDSEGTSIRGKAKYLEVILRQSDLVAARNAFKAWRHSPRKEARCFFGIVGTLGPPRHYSVSLAGTNVIRIAWRNRGEHWVSPSLKQALEILENRVQRDSPRRVDHADWRKLTEEEFDAHILALVQSGRHMNAAQLLTQRRGYSTTEAHIFVKGLNART